MDEWMDDWMGWRQSSMLICGYRGWRSVLACVKKNAHDRLYKKTSTGEKSEEMGEGVGRREREKGRYRYIGELQRVKEREKNKQNDAVGV